MEKLPFFPAPYPDEIFYSVISRYHYWSRNKFTSWTFDDLFDNSSTSICIDFPNNLNDLCMKFSRKSSITPNKIIYDHTLLPLYLPFISIKNSEDVINSIIGENSSKVSMLVGTTQNKIKNPRYLRYCEDCFQDDLHYYGEPYWRREHQVFGVLLCPIHNNVLYETTYDVRNSYPLRKCYQLFPEDLRSAIPVLASQEHIIHLEYLSKSIRNLLNNQYECLGLDKLRERYLFYLGEKNLTTYNGRIKENELNKELVNFYGDGFLQAMNSKIVEGKRNNWTEGFFRTKKVHPLRHLLIMNFLGLSITDFMSNPISEYRPFGQGPWLCYNAASLHYKQPVIDDLTIKNNTNKDKLVGIFKCKCGFEYSRKGPDLSPIDKNRVGRIRSFGYVWEAELIKLRYEEKKTVNTIAKTLKTTHLTISRKLKEMNNKIVATQVEDITIDIKMVREKWIQLINDNPQLGRNELRKLAKKEYIFLYRNDKKWLMTNLPKPLKKNNVRKSHYLITEDKALSEKITLTVDRLIRLERPKRITKTLIGKELGVSIRKIDNSPISKKTIEASIESKEDFQIRRIELAVIKLLGKGEYPTPHKLKKEAGLLQQDLSQLIISKINSISKNF